MADTHQSLANICKNSKMQKYTNSQIHKNTNSQIFTSEKKLLTMVRSVSEDKLYDTIEFNEFLQVALVEQDWKGIVNCCRTICL